MTHYPLLFGFKDLIAGNGFVAGVALDGRGLLVDEGDGFWMYGVNPGGVAGGGKSAAEAQAEFRRVYRSVLFDIAGEAEDFEEFRRQVERLFKTNEANLAEWKGAVAEVRAGQVTAEWLPKKPADSRIGMEVELLENPTPEANQVDEVELAAA